ncbi:MAG: excalibur calcium-binding domain-containing protein [Ilumatobacteraceae bacterium]
MTSSRTTRVRRGRTAAAAALGLLVAGCAAGGSGVVAVPGSGADTVVVDTTARDSTTIERTTPTESTAVETTEATTTPPTTAPTTATTTVAPTTTATPAATVAPRPGQLLALDVLGLIRVENEHRGGYVRDAFGYPADFDGDSCNTRAEVLQQEAVGLVQVDQPGCVVREGDWVSLYDGLAVTDAADLEIDHVVALKEAWDSGAWRWDPMTLVAYGNDLTDPRTLRAVTSATNRSKSDKDPSNWLPPVGVCEYLGDWVAIKARWSMTMDQSEYGRIRNVLRGTCAGTTTAPFTPVDATRGYLDRPFVSIPPTTTPAVVSGGGSSGGNVYYRNCDAARAAGAAPLYAGDPGYRSGLDGDDDGVACEG